jgi:hypothetical protein
LIADGLLVFALADVVEVILLSICRRRPGHQVVSGGRQRDDYRRQLAHSPLLVLSLPGLGVTVKE